MNLIKLVRYVINNYYNEESLKIFDESLNLNYKYFINKNYNNLSLKDINDLMSKFIYFYFYIENRGIYEIKYCIGKGVTGRVNNKNIYF